MKRIPFVKYTLHGNKFVIVDETSEAVLTESEKSQFAYQATNIYYGVASDNLIVIQTCNSETLDEINDAHHYWDEGELPYSAEADYIFRMFEPDGEEAFSCGNGLLCISNYLYVKYGITSARIITEIPTSTPKIITIGTDLQENMNWSNMGNPRKIPHKLASPLITIPYSDKTDAIDSMKINFLNNGIFGFKKNISLNISGYLAFTGEPHFVVFTENGFSSPELGEYIFQSCGEKKINFSSRLVHQIGTSVNNDYKAYFPKGLNINFVHILDNSGMIEYRCFERGINRETWACGTGAVAASFIAIHLNMIKGNQVTILPYCANQADGDAHLSVKVDGDDYFLYGNPLLLFEGSFFFNKQLKESGTQKPQRSDRSETQFGKERSVCPAN